MTPLRLLAWVSGIALIAVPAASLTIFLLAMVGSPGACDSRGRPIEPSLEAAAAFDQKWNELNATLDAGQVSAATFTETEATSRAQVWVAQHDVPVEDLRVCFNPEGGSASGRIDVPVLPGDVDVIVRGTLILTGDEPDVEIEGIEVGTLPGPLAGLAEGIVNGIIEDEADEIPLRHDYGLAFGEGEVTISGQP